jgi:transcriptional regulator GlxA family with amidase domain
MCRGEDGGVAAPVSPTRWGNRDVAEQAGFGSYASLRYHFLRTVGVPPQKYRQSYTASR